MKINYELLKSEWFWAGYLGGAALAALFVLLSILSSQVDAAPDFYDNFENYTTGPIDGQQGWSNVIGATVVVQINDTSPLNGSLSVFMPEFASIGGIPWAGVQKTVGSFDDAKYSLTVNMSNETLSRIETYLMDDSTNILCGIGSYTPNATFKRWFFEANPVEITTQTVLGDIIHSLSIYVDKSVRKCDFIVDGISYPGRNFYTNVSANFTTASIFSFDGTGTAKPARWDDIRVMSSTTTTTTSSTTTTLPGGQNDLDFDFEHCTDYPSDSRDYCNNWFLNSSYGTWNGTISLLNNTDSRGTPHGDRAYLTSGDMTESNLTSNFLFKMPLGTGQVNMSAYMREGAGTGKSVNLCEFNASAPYSPCIASGANKICSAYLGSYTSGWTQTLTACGNLGGKVLYLTIYNIGTCSSYCNLAVDYIRFANSSGYVDPVNATGIAPPTGDYSLAGTVTNSTGVIPFALVYGENTNASFFAVADAGGYYSVNLTLPGVYDLEVLSVGYGIRCGQVYVNGHVVENWFLSRENLGVSVYDFQTLRPVEGAIVIAQDDLSPTVNYATITDNLGSSRLLVPEDRSYTLLIRHEDFLDYSLSLGSVHCTQDITVNLENVSVNYSLYMHVYDQYSLTDMPGVLVGLYGAAPGAMLITYCMTDGTGRCTLWTDGPGDYRLKTGYPGYMTDNRTITVDGDSFYGLGLVPMATYNLTGWVKKGSRNASGEELWYSCQGPGWSYNITGNAVSNGQGYYKIPLLYNNTVCQLSHDLRNYVDYTATVPILGHTTWNITLADHQVYQFAFIDRLTGRPLENVHVNIRKNGTYSDTQVITGAMIGQGIGYAWVLAGNQTNISLQTESDLTAAQEFSHLTNFGVDASVNYAFAYYLDRLSHEERGGCIQNFQIWPLQLRQNLSSLYYLHYQIQAYNLNDSLIFTYDIPIYLVYNDLRDKPYWEANLSCGLRHVITLAMDSPEYSMAPITFSSRYLANTIRLPLSLKAESGGGSIGGSVGLPNQLLAIVLGALGYDANAITVFMFIVGLATMTIIVILVAGMARVVKGR